MGEDRTGRRRSVQTTHTLRLTLQGVAPRVWRLLQVQSEVRFDERHAILDAAMGWMGERAHAFLLSPSRRAHTLLSGGGPSPVVVGDEYGVVLGKALPSVGASLLYEYDYGDPWQLVVEATAIENRLGRTARASCIGGGGATPSEDYGGPRGYAEFHPWLALSPSRVPSERGEQQGHGTRGAERFDVRVVNDSLRRAR